MRAHREDDTWPFGLRIHGNFIYYCQNGQALEPLFATLMAVKLFVHCSSCEPAGEPTHGHLGCGIHGNFIYYWQNGQFLEPLFATLTATKLFVHCSSCEPAGKTTRGHLGCSIQGIFIYYCTVRMDSSLNPCLPHGRLLSFSLRSSWEPVGRQYVATWVAAFMTTLYITKWTIFGNLVGHIDGF